MAAKSKTPQVAVFDQNGKLIGTIDPEVLQPVQAASPARAAAPARPSTGVNQPPQSEVDQQAAEITDTMEKALGGLKPRPAHLRKAVGVAPATAGWAALVKQLEAESPTHALRVKQAVSASALKLMLSGASSRSAVAVAKSAAVNVAARKGVV